MENRPILSICIPIYNRLECLRLMLNRFIEDKELFSTGEIQLFVSDNCSSDNLQDCIDKFMEKGLRIDYHRNSSNLGMDGNFANCFKHATGKYVWLLGSDDIPERGKIREVLDILKKQDINALFLTNNDGSGKLVKYRDAQAYLRKVSILITFISCNIVSTKFVHEVDLKKYEGTLFTQVPLYLTAITAEEGICAIYNSRIFGDMDRKTGGYNVFDVFVNKFLSICGEFVSSGRISKKNYNSLRYDIFRKIVCNHAYQYLVLKKESTFDLTGGWDIIKREYAKDAYFYYYPIWFYIKQLLKKIVR